MRTFDLFKICELFDNQIHINVITPMNISKPRILHFKGNLHPKIANEILSNYIPVIHIWDYKQDKRIKHWKYVENFKENEE